MDPRQGAEEEDAAEHDIHARLLLAVHQECLEFGLKLDDPEELSAPLKQNDAGAFPPLRYNGGGRVVVVHGLAMFDNLIVSATAAPAQPPASVQQDAEDFARRRIVLSTAAGDGEGGWEDQDQPRPKLETDAAPAGTSPPWEALRSRVRSGLLLHLCPSPGPFADLFGCGDEVRRRILGVLGARDLATFAMTSRSGAVSAVANSLWGPLLQASFPERNFLEELTRPPPQQRSPSSLDRDYHRRRRAGGGAAQNRDGGDHDHDHDHEEGSLWRYYSELATKKRLRELALEQARALGRDDPFFPRFITPYGSFAGNGNGNGFAPLPAAPWHAPGPAFPEYDWGPGIGGGAGFSPPPGPPGPPPTSTMVIGPGGRWLQYAGPSVVGGPPGVGGVGGIAPDDPGGDWTASDLQRWY